jgi:hypothetical protein
MKVSSDTKNIKEVLEEVKVAAKSLSKNEAF